MENNCCKICSSRLEKFFSKKILEKYNITYFRCINCGFVQTEKPFWLEEAYSDAITKMDVGLVNRNLQFSKAVEGVIYNYFNKEAKFLDFAGGYGLFTRIMRDKGFDFYHYDKYCDNIFAKHFTLDDLKSSERKFELITAFEFMEHIADPFIELDCIFSMTDNFIFSTIIVPEGDIEKWWYLATEHGQHVSFYTKDSLEKIAKKYGKILHSSGELHIITNEKNNPFDESSVRNLFFKGMIKKNSPKTQDDFEFIKKCQK